MKKLIVLFLIPIFLLCELNAQEGSSSKTDTETLLVDPTERDMEFKKNNNQLSSDGWEEYKRIDRSKKKSALESTHLSSEKTENSNRAYKDIRKDIRETCKKNKLDPEKFGEEFSNQDYELCMRSTSGKKEWQR